MALPPITGQYWPPLGGTSSGSVIPFGVTPGAVPGWTGSGWVPALFVLDATGAPVASASGNLTLVEDD
jgi:hypothetical protein